MRDEGPPLPVIREGRQVPEDWKTMKVEVKKEKLAEKMRRRFKELVGKVGVL